MNITWTDFAAQFRPRVIVESWQRCELAQVPRDQPPAFHPVELEDLARRLQSTAPLINAAREYVESLSRMFSPVRHVIYITDADGIVLLARGDSELIRTFALQPGFDWSEERMGTNGAGTALKAGCPVAVVGPEHYLSTFENCTCTAAPIRDPLGRIIGALDISTSVADASPHRIAVVATAATAIEQAVAAAQRHADLLTEIANTESRERRRLAKRVDDSLALPLHDASVPLTSAVDTAIGPVQRQLLSTAFQSLCRAITAANRLAETLAPPALIDGDLPAALRWLAEEYRLSYRLDIALDADFPPHLIPDRLRALCYEFTRELLHNAAVHARGSLVAINLHVNPSSSIHLTVQDDGVGFDPDSLKSVAPARGLPHLIRRVKLLGGSCILSTQPNAGCRVELSLPIHDAV